jgi:hypothetical protein
MQFIKRSVRAHPKITLIFLDWSVRESFHVLHYLKTQTVSRDEFEVVVVEFYSRVSEAIRQFEDEVDTWVILEMPGSCCYHKHLMYNAGIAVARGEVVMIGDSDAMVKSSFIESILRGFARNSDIVYHMDEFRNMRRDFYPFNYPKFSEVLGDGCFNNVNGRSTGVLDEEDPIHSRNYGACMCARRDDLIEIGGADMHIDYAGHICGPYEMTFRLVNYGRREIWDRDEFLYHTWHPGQAGADNYMGPHDGRHMSTIALEAITSRRVRPLLENEAIRRLRTGEARSVDDVLDQLIDPRYRDEWDRQSLERNGAIRRWSDYRVPLGTYKGYRLEAEVDRVFAYAIGQPEAQGEQDGNCRWIFEGESEAQTKAQIDRSIPLSLVAVSYGAVVLDLFSRAIRSLVYRSQRLPGPLGRRAKIFVAVALAVPAAVALLLLHPHRVIEKSKRVLSDATSSASSLAPLILALYCLNAQTSGSRHVGKTVVLADDDRTAMLLPWLARLGLAPRLEARRIKDRVELERCLAQLESEEWSGHLLVPTMLLARFHSIIAASPMLRRAIVA